MQFTDEFLENIKKCLIQSINTLKFDFPTCCNTHLFDVNNWDSGNTKVSNFTNKTWHLEDHKVNSDIAISKNNKRHRKSAPTTSQSQYLIRCGLHNT